MTIFEAGHGLRRPRALTRQTQTHNRRTPRRAHPDLGRRVRQAAFQHRLPHRHVPWHWQDTHPVALRLPTRHRRAPSHPRSRRAPRGVADHRVAHTPRRSHRLLDLQPPRPHQTPTPRSPRQAVVDYRAPLPSTQGELGLDHYEGRSYLGWYHHTTLVTNLTRIPHTRTHRPQKPSGGPHAPPSGPSIHAHLRLLVRSLPHLPTTN